LRAAVGLYAASMDAVAAQARVGMSRRVFQGYGHLHFGLGVNFDLGLASPPAQSCSFSG